MSVKKKPFPGWGDWSKSTSTSTTICSGAKKGVRLCANFVRIFENIFDLSLNKIIPKISKQNGTSSFTETAQEAGGEATAEIPAVKTSGTKKKNSLGVI